MSESGKAAHKQEPEPVTFAEFLTAVPPGAGRVVIDAFEIEALARLIAPDIRLHCDNEHCGGERTFRASPRVYELGVSGGHEFVTYTCSNCGVNLKTYALSAHRPREFERAGWLVKFGELPPYGPHTPARLLTLLKPYRETFLKGRRCEAQGLGIGAFAYYRRIVEEQKDRLFDEVIKVAERTGARSEVIELLKRAKAEIQFSKGLEMAQDAVPESLRINGQNPLTLLHGALSAGLHARSDEECLDSARAVRLVLQALAERAAEALKEHAELAAAIGKLRQR